MGSDKQVDDLANAIGFAFRWYLGLFVVFGIVAFILLSIVDLWRIWYSLLFGGICIWTLKMQSWDEPPPMIALKIIGILGVTVMPYAVIQLLIYFGHLQFLADGLGLWKCQGDLDWFWNNIDTCLN